MGILKGARAVRAIRLLRLLKLQRLVNKMYDMIENEATFIFVNLLKLLGSVLVLNHIIACLWYMLGRYGVTEDSNNWIAHSNILHRTLSFKYTTSLHWSLTQFTPAGMDVSAKNTYERIFSIIVLFFAMVAFSSIVGGITAGMASLRNLKQDQTKQLWLLRRYMRQRGVNPELSLRIFHFLEHQTEAASSLVQDDQIKPLLGQLSAALMNELKYHNLAGSLTYPLFEHVHIQMVGVMHRLSRVALCIETFGGHDGIFACGDKAKKVYFLRDPVAKQGHQARALQAGYIPMGTGVLLDPPPALGEAIGEGALWTTWRHQGSFFATDPCELICLDAGLFSDVMCSHPRPWQLAARYAVLFVDLLNTRPLIHDIVRDSVFVNEVKKVFEEDSEVAMLMEPDNSDMGKMGSQTC
eukprot:NODE_315_length_1676_cov_699.497841.p1 GENE.NODE_315_length_1676_cov_699.497841~~NODE_315_length_1676_cov_699.497841.p1  ORF type:complete len:410 (-),score=101.64 NODE_315_length_1676_cov_699.497841:429-1658(-)